MKTTKHVARIEPEQRRLLIVAGTEPYGPGVDELPPSPRVADRAVRFDREAETRPNAGGHVETDSERERRLAPTVPEMVAARESKPPPSDAGRYSLIVGGLRLRRPRRGGLDSRSQ